MFQGLSAVTFPAQGLRAEVSRKHRMAGVFDLVTQQPIGMLHRVSEGHLDWQYCAASRSCPIEVFDVVASMITNKEDSSNMVDLKHIVVLSDKIGGQIFIGPFDSEDEAKQWATDNAEGVYVNIRKIQSP